MLLRVDVPVDYSGADLSRMVIIPAVIFIADFYEVFRIMSFRQGVELGEGEAPELGFRKTEGVASETPEV